MQHQGMHPAYRLEPGRNFKIIAVKYQEQEKDVQEEDRVDNERTEDLHELGLIG